MSLRDDAVFLEMIDELTIGNVETLEKMVNYLFNGVWKGQISQPASILVAIVEWNKTYVALRDSGMEAQIAIDTSTARLLSNPNIQELVASLVAKQMGGV